MENDNKTTVEINAGSQLIRCYGDVGTSIRTGGSDVVSVGSGESITVTITRTFTRNDDPLDVFGMCSVPDNEKNAADELKWLLLYTEDWERRLSSAEALLESAEWKVS